MSYSRDDVLIPPNAKILRSNESESEGNEDRLSDLPDSILLHILSFFKPKNAVQTCILSTRWKNLWKGLQTLILHYSPDFLTFQKFIKFVSMLLTHRDGSIALHSLDFELVGSTQPRLLEMIGNYAVSHNVQQLRLTLGDILHIPPSVFSCHTLTSLKLKVYFSSRRSLFPESLNLPALTTLHLEDFAFCANGNDPRVEPFSALIRLKSLIIRGCTLNDEAHILCISSATLTNLTVFNYNPKDLDTIELSSPKLRSLTFKGAPYLRPTGCNLSSLEEVNIDVGICSQKQVKFASILLSWLLKLVNIRSLTVSTSTLQVLSLIPNILKMKLPLWTNLKRLIINRRWLSYELILIIIQARLAKAATESLIEAAKLQEEAEMLWERRGYPTVLLPDGMVDFLLQNSPSSAEVETVD